MHAPVMTQVFWAQRRIDKCEGSCSIQMLGRSTGSYVRSPSLAAVYRFPSSVVALHGLGLKFKQRWPGPPCTTI